MTKKEIKKGLEDLRDNWKFTEVETYSEYDDNYLSLYLGSFMSLDPCGRYHHTLSPNGATKTCERYWENLESAAEELGMWIESGEGDPTDIYLCKQKD